MYFWSQLKHARVIPAEKKNKGTMLVNNQELLKARTVQTLLVQTRDRPQESQGRIGNNR
jgi:hypothetical protein